MDRLHVLLIAAAAAVAASALTRLLTSAGDPASCPEPFVILV
jgi:hypothetical protein